MWAFISIIDVSKDERLLKHIHYWLSVNYKRIHSFYPFRICHTTYWL